MKLLNFTKPTLILTLSNESTLLLLDTQICSIKNFFADDQLFGI